MYTMKFHSFVSKTTIGILGLLYLNFLSVCIFTISCSSYIPTLSYLASFRTHDVSVVLTLTFFAFSLVPVFFSWHIKTQGKLSLEELIFMILLEIAIIVLCITDGLIDEVNGIEFNPVDNLHQFLSFTLCLVSIIWVYYALSFLELCELTSAEKIALYNCWAIYKIGLLFVLLTLYQ